MYLIINYTLILQALLNQCGQYLSLNVPGLAEGRPSIIVGDRVILCEPGKYVMYCTVQ